MSLRLLFSLCIQPPRKQYWSLSALIILLGLGCLCELQSVFDRHVWMSCITVKKGQKLFLLQILRVCLGFDSWSLYKQVWHLPKWPICLSADPMLNNKLLTWLSITYCMWVCMYEDSIHICIHAYVIFCIYVCVCVRICARACGQKYRSVHPALPPSVLRQATGHFILSLSILHIALFVFIHWFIKLFKCHQFCVSILKEICASLMPAFNYLELLKYLKCILIATFVPTSI